jgi:hypothetical protein
MSIRNLFIILIAIVIFGTVPMHSYTGMFPGDEGGIQMLEGLVPSNQTKESLLRTPWLAKATRKCNKKFLGKFTSMEKGTLLPLTKQMWHFHGLEK